MNRCLTILCIHHGEMHPLNVDRDMTLRDHAGPLLRITENLVCKYVYINIDFHEEPFLENFSNSSVICFNVGV